MTRILTTMPGKFGDILWAMPTVRAIAETFGVAVDFMTSGAYGRIAPLVQAQEYIEQTIINHDWQVMETAPMTPWAAPLTPGNLGTYDRIFDLGYRGWPTEAHLPHEVYKNATAMKPQVLAPLDLDRPWIKVANATRDSSDAIFVGWNEQWIELKMGVTFAVAPRFPHHVFTISKAAAKSRHSEWECFEPWRGPARMYWVNHNWLQAAAAMEVSSCYLGCLSSLWVLANAMGKKTVVMEPDPQRARNPLFWLPRERNHMVIGGDGLPTFDARHVGDALKEVLG